jgi:hypothetical protein
VTSAEQFEVISGGTPMPAGAMLVGGGVVIDVGEITEVRVGAGDEVDGAVVVGTVV